MAASHYKSPDVKESTQQLSKDWKKLVVASADKGIICVYGNIHNG